MASFKEERQKAFRTVFDKYVPSRYIMSEMEHELGQALDNYRDRVLDQVDAMRRVYTVTSAEDSVLEEIKERITKL